MAELHLDVISTSSSKGLTDAQRELKETRTEAGRLNKSFDELEHESFDLEKAIAASRLEVMRLTQEFKKTGDRTLLFDLKREKSTLHELEMVAGIGGSAAGAAFSSGMGLGMRQMRGPLIAILVGTAIAAAPTVGAVLGGAVAGAIGTVGIAGGVVMAMKDTRVLNALSDFGAVTLKEFFRGGEAFVSPIINSLAILRQAFFDMKVPEAFERMAPLVTTIARGLADFGRNIMPGLNQAFSRMGPYADVAAEGFADMGSAFSQFLSDVTASRGTLQGLAALFHGVNNIIIGTGNFIRWLSDRMYEFNTAVHKSVDVLLAWPAAFGGPHGAFRDALEMLDKGLDDIESHDVGVGLADTAEAINGLVYPTRNATEGMKDFRERLVEVQLAMVGIQNEISEMIDSQLGLDRATLAVEQGWADLTETLDKNGGAWLNNTQAARDNESAIIDQIDKLAAQRDAMIKVTGATGEANFAYNEEIKTLIDLGVKAGISREALENLAGQYYVDVVFQSNYSRWLRDFGPLLPGFSGGPWGAVTSFQHGGTTPAREPFLVGERGPELMYSDRQHYVASKTQMKAMPSAGWDGASLGGGNTAMEMHFSGDVDSAFAAAFMKLIRNGAITIASRAVVA